MTANITAESEAIQSEIFVFFQATVYYDFKQHKTSFFPVLSI